MKRLLFSNTIAAEELLGMAEGSRQLGGILRLASWGGGRERGGRVRRWGRRRRPFAQNYDSMDLEITDQLNLRGVLKTSGSLAAVLCGNCGFRQGLNTSGWKAKLSISGVLTFDANHLFENSESNKFPSFELLLPTPTQDICSTPAVLYSLYFLMLIYSMQTFRVQSLPDVRHS